MHPALKGASDVLEAVAVGERGPAGAGGALGRQLVVHVADQERHLEPAQGGDGLDGGDTVGDRLEGDARGDVAAELGDLRDDVTDDGKHAHAAVLELGGAVESELLLVNVLGQAQRVEEAGRLEARKGEGRGVGDVR